MVRFTSVKTPVGQLFVAISEAGVCATSFGVDETEFVRQLALRGGEAARAAARDGQAARAAARDGEPSRPAVDDGEPGPPVVRDDSLAAQLQVEVDRWFEGREVDLPLDMSGCTAFQRRVMEEVRRIPRGSVRSYADVARAVGRPGAARAVGQVMAANPLALWVPCHRVVRSDGRLGGYSGGGPEIKRRLLELEGVPQAAPSKGLDGPGGGRA